MGDSNTLCIARVYLEGTLLPQSGVIPINLSIDSWGALRDVDGRILDDAELDRCMRRMNQEDVIDVSLRLQEGFEGKVTAQELSKAIIRISRSASAVGPQAARKLRLILVLPTAQT